MADKDLQIKITASSDQAVQAIKEVSRSLSQIAQDAKVAIVGFLSFEKVGATISAFGKSLDAASKQMKKFGRDFTANITVPLLAIGALSLKKIFDDAVLGKGTEATNQFAASVQTLKAQFDGLLVTVGTTLIPIMTKVVGVLQQVIAAFQSLSPSTQEFIVQAGVIAAAIGPVILAISSFVGIAGKILSVLGPVISFLPRIIAFFTGPIAGISALVLAVAGLINIFLDLKKAGATTSESFIMVWNLAVGFFQKYVVGSIVTGIDYILTGFAKVVGFVDKELAESFQSAANFAAGVSQNLSEQFDAAAGAVNAKLATIGKTAGESFTFGLSKGLTGVKDSFNNVTAQTGTLVTKQMEDTAKKALEIAKQVKESFSAGLATAMIDFATGAETAGRAFEKFASSFLKQIAQMILQAQILNLLQSFGGFNAAAGSVGTASAPRALADGGYVTGPGTSRSDSIPAWLSNGEFVSDAKTVAAYGPDFFRNLKSMARRGTGMKSGRPAFAEGGLVSNPGQAPQVVIQNSGSPKQVSSTSYDPATAVTTVILQDIEKNGPISKGMQNTFGVRRGNFK